MEKNLDEIKIITSKLKKKVPEKNAKKLRKEKVNRKTYESKPRTREEEERYLQRLLSMSADELKEYEDEEPPCALERVSLHIKT